MTERATGRAVIPSPAVLAAEDERVRVAYERRRQTIPPSRYARTDLFALFEIHGRERAMASLFRSEGLLSLTGVRILDVGCGRGDIMRQLLEYGADPGLVTGIDLLDDNVKSARRLAPHLEVVCGSATSLPFPDASFDLVLQFTLFTSILNYQVKRTIAAEMNRVLAPGGRILWYDFRVNNPRNPDVRGIGRREIQELFPGFRAKIKQITLAPPLGRIIAPRSILLYHALSQVRPLCTHLLCLLQKLART